MRTIFTTSWASTGVWTSSGDVLLGGAAESGVGVAGGGGGG